MPRKREVAEIKEWLQEEFHTSVTYSPSLPLPTPKNQDRDLVNVKEKFNTLSANTSFAVNLISVFLPVAQFMSGVMSINMPSVLQGFNHLSPLRYAIRNLAPYSVSHIFFTCCENRPLLNEECPIQMGK